MCSCNHVTGLALEELPNYYNPWLFAFFYYLWLVQYLRALSLCLSIRGTRALHNSPAHFFVCSCSSSLSEHPCLVFWKYLILNVAFLIEKEMILMVKTYPKKRPFVEFVWLSCLRAGKLSRWNAAAKANWLWPIRNALWNGLASKVTRLAMCANKRFRICLWLLWKYKASTIEQWEALELSRKILVNTGKWMATFIYTSVMYLSNLCFLLVPSNIGCSTFFLGSDERLPVLKVDM